MLEASLTYPTVCVCFDCPSLPGRCGSYAQEYVKTAVQLAREAAVDKTAAVSPWKTAMNTVRTHGITGLYKYVWATR